MTNLKLDDFIVNKIGDDLFCSGKICVIFKTYSHPSDHPFDLLIYFEKNDTNIDDCNDCVIYYNYGSLLNNIKFARKDILKINESVFSSDINVINDRKYCFAWVKQKNIVGEIVPIVETKTIKFENIDICNRCKTKFTELKNDLFCSKCGIWQTDPLMEIT